MTNYSLSFFPEVQLNFIGASCEINSPWMNTNVTLPQEVKSDYDEWSKLIAHSLIGFPFIKVAPKYPITWDYDTLEEIVQNFSKEVINITQLENIILAWDHKKIVKESAIKEGFCSLSAFSLIQKEMFSNFPISKSAKNVNTIIATLQQSYYVTSQCCEALEGAISFFNYELEEYINSEKGHHHIIEKALNCLKAKHDLTQIHPATISCIKLLKFTAEYYPFAFCCSLSFFEQGSFYETDPLVDSLLSMGEQEAAKAVNIHFSINKKDAHHMIGFNLVQQIPIVSTKDLLIGSIVCETLIQLSHELNDYLNNNNNG
jgi:hypothetical protein